MLILLGICHFFYFSFNLFHHVVILDNIANLVNREGFDSVYRALVLPGCRDQFSVYRAEVAKFIFVLGNNSFAVLLLQVGEVHLAVDLSSLRQEVSQFFDLEVRIDEVKYFRNLLCDGISHRVGQIVEDVSD